MPEVEARRRLGPRAAVLSVLAPVGCVAGKGALRVLRASLAARDDTGDSGVALVCGYDGYDLDALRSGAR